MYSKALQPPSLILSPKDSKILKAPIKGSIYISEAPSSDLTSSLSSLKDEYKISKIICLMEDWQLTSWCGIDPQEYESVAGKEDIVLTRFPIPDLEVPQDKSKFDSFLKKEITSLMKSKPCNVLVHCYGGHGRSGLMAGCVLADLTKIATTKEIVKFIRERRDPWCVETREQQEFIQNYSERRGKLIK